MVDDLGIFPRRFIGFAVDRDLSIRPSDTQTDRGCLEFFSLAGSDLALGAASP